MDFKAASASLPVASACQISGLPSFTLAGSLGALGVWVNTSLQCGIIAHIKETVRATVGSLDTNHARRFISNEPQP